MRTFLLLSCCLIACCAAAWGEEPQGPALPAYLANPAPIIDGDLGDDAWIKAPHLGGFVRQDVQKPATEDTEAWICYDQHWLYAAFRCHDTQPDQIHCLQTKRNAGIWSDDWVMLNLDAAHAHNLESVFEFYVTPRGTQSEVIPGGTARQVTWKGDWRAAAKITETGWQAEMAVPLRMLRYAPGQDTFGVLFRRYLQRADECSCWPFIGLDSQREPRLTANLGALSLPPLRLPLVVMPYLLSDLGEQDREPLTSGLDLKQELPNGTTALLTVHPDFRTIEDQVLSIDYTYVERLQSDLRPFFLEGSQGYYFPQQEMLYTRRIPEVNYGLKWFGTLGTRQMGILSVATPGGGQVLTARHSWDITVRQSHTLSVVQNSGGPWPRGWVWFSGYWQEWVQPVGTLTLSSHFFGSDYAGQAGTRTWNRVLRDRGVNHWSYGGGFLTNSQGFRPPLGYVPEVGLRQGSLWLWKEGKPEGGRRQRTYDNLELSTGPALDGYRNSLWLNRWLEFRNQRILSAGIGLEQREGHTDQTLALGHGWRQDHLYRSGGMEANLGRRAGGDYRYVSAYQGWKLGGRLYANLQAEHLRLDAPGDIRDELQVVGTTGWDISPERSVHCRVISRSGKVNASLSYRQEVRQGADAYLILGDPNAEATVSRIALKLVWPVLY